jgi:type IV fimbrial biogenesis protein FimT
MHKSAHSGFSLIELMVTLSVAAILVAIAIPNISGFMRNSRLTSGVNDLLHAFNVARTEAIKRQAGNVVVCGTTGPRLAAPACAYNTFRGWIVFVDADNNWQFSAGDTILERHAVLDATVTIKTDANANIVSYAPTGFANTAGAQIPTGFMVLCDSRGVVAAGNNSTARAVVISPTGRARTSAVQSDIAGNVLPNIVGGGCP